MNSGKKLRSRSIDARHRARLAACLLLTSLGAISVSHAASFRCPRDASASERIVCADPALSSLDDKLAAVFRAAHEAAPDPTALDADRVTQWQWRQRNCKDKACVADWYTRRISELEADVVHGMTQTAKRTKAGIAEQRLAPSAEAAVLRLKGLAAAKDEQTGAVPGQGDIERLRTVTPMSMLNMSHSSMTGRASAPCPTGCAQGQVRIAF
ncbi:lipoprotein [Caballeronia fortuita]|uniref:Lipoprotein n=1 Tax=Caballeronia fortuita TaxID=1777138 RepID=A0A158DVV7_9BURK|nr:hypothetical protein [Caballeronia fortuita]SAK98779.1 lipoprotein [Caballeronia fortuita]